MPQTALRLVILTIFLVSGAAALLYEVVWMRALALIFGVTTYATATVLATFMGGLALGSFVFGRRVDRLSNPLIAYAVLEAGIGLYALAVPSIFVALRPVHIWLYHLELPYLAFGASRALLAAAILLVPTFLMGGTFPMLVRFFVDRRQDIGRGTGFLYFINTAGGVAGCLLGGFYLIEELGMQRSTQVAAACNLAVAAVAVLLARRLGPAAASSPAEPEPSSGPTISPAAIRLALICVGVSGFTSLAYEVLWTRALGRYLYNSTYAFTTMLSTFLAGIAIGSAIYSSLMTRIRRPVRLFALLQLLVGIGFAMSALLFVDLLDHSSAILGETIRSFGESIQAMFVRSSLILFLPTLFLGATFPLAMSICTRGVGSIGTSLGRVYAINTLGSILGSLAVAFVLIPLLGMYGSLILIVGTNLTMAIALTLVEFERVQSRIVAGVVMVAAVLALLMNVPADLFKRTFLQYSGELVFYEEGTTDTVAVVEVPVKRTAQRAIVYGDLRGTAGTYTAHLNYFSGHLPILLHPGEPKSVLHICFGVGNSLAAVASHDSIEHIDNVELSPHAIDAAPYFWTNDDVVNSPKVNTVIEDGRTFLMASRKTYDIVSLEPPETFTAGVINLYTREFYEDAAAHMAPDGVILQWVQVGQASMAEERMLFRAFYDAFPHATAWQQLYDGAVLLVGTKSPFSIDYQLLTEKMGRPNVARDLGIMSVEGVDHLLSFFVFGPREFADFVEGVPSVTEDQTRLDFSMPRHIGSGYGFGLMTWRADSAGVGMGPEMALAQRLAFYSKRRRPVVPYLRNIGDVTRQELLQRIGRASRIKPKSVMPLTPESLREIRASSLARHQKPSRPEQPSRPPG